MRVTALIGRIISELVAAEYIDELRRRARNAQLDYDVVYDDNAKLKNELAEAQSEIARLRAITIKNAIKKGVKKVITEGNS
jgi:hypothetical protein